MNCLRELLDAGIRPKLVIANLDDTGKDTWHESLVKVVKQKKLPLVQNRKLKNAHVIKRIRAIHPEIIFCIGAFQIIPPDVLKIPQKGCLNIHPALLPKYRGRYSTAWAIFNGEKETGVTVHWMDEGVDSGPIIMQKKFSITNTDTAKTVYDKFTKTGTELFGIFLKKWLQGRKTDAMTQNEHDATYYKKGLPNNGQIDWSWDGKKLYNFIRAMTFEPFPPPSFTIGKKKMVIVDNNSVKSKK